MASLPLPDPPLDDGVVRLRPWTAADAPALVSAWAQDDVQRFNGVPPRRDLGAARRWIASTPALRQRGLSLDLVVVVAGDGRLLGEVGLSGFGAGPPRTAQVGWWVLAAEQGRGTAARATDLLVTWALGPPLQLQQVEAQVAEANVASRRVAQRAGFASTDHPERWVRGDA